MNASMMNLKLWPFHITPADGSPRRTIAVLDVSDVGQVTLELADAHALGSALVDLAAKWSPTAEHPLWPAEHPPACLCDACRARREAAPLSVEPSKLHDSGQRSPKGAEGSGEAGCAEQPAANGVDGGGAL